MTDKILLHLKMKNFLVNMEHGNALAGKFQGLHIMLLDNRTELLKEMEEAFVKRIPIIARSTSSHAHVLSVFVAFGSKHMSLFNEEMSHGGTHTREPHG